MPHHRPNRRERVALDAEDREIGRGEILDAIGSRKLNYVGSFGRPYLQTTIENCLEIFPARIERNVVSRARQLAAVIGADSAGAEYDDFHRRAKSRLGVTPAFC